MYGLIPTACQYGRYGLNCSLDCGHCIDSTNCNHVNGTCTLGCAPGWQNLDKCVTRKYRFHFLYDIVYDEPFSYKTSSSEIYIYSFKNNNFQNLYYKESI